MKHLTLLLLCLILGNQTYSQCSDLLEKGKVSEIYYSKNIVLHYLLDKMSKNQLSEVIDDNKGTLGIGDFTFGLTTSQRDQTATQISTMKEKLDYSYFEEYLQRNYFDQGTLEKWLACVQNEPLFIYSKETQTDDQYKVFVKYGSKATEKGKITDWTLTNSDIIFPTKVSASNFGDKKFQGEKEILVSRKQSRKPIDIGITIQSSTGDTFTKTFNIPPLPLTPIADYFEQPLQSGKTTISFPFSSSSEVDQQVLMVLMTNSDEHRKHDETITHQALRVREKGQILGADQGYWGTPNKDFDRYSSTVVSLEKGKEYIVEGYVNFRTWPSDYFQEGKVIIYVINKK